MVCCLNNEDPLGNGFSPEPAALPHDAPSMCTYLLDYSLKWFIPLASSNSGLLQNAVIKTLEGNKFLFWPQYTKCIIIFPLFCEKEKNYIGDHKISMCVTSVNSHFLTCLSPGPPCRSLKLGRLQGALLSVLTKLLITHPVIHLVSHQGGKKTHLKTNWPS